MRATIAAMAMLWVVPVAAGARTLAEPDARLDGPAIMLADEPDRWDPYSFRDRMEERLVALLPDGLIEGVARTFASRTLQIELGPDRAFLRLRLHL